MKPLTTEIIVFFFGGLFLILGVFMIKSSYIQLETLNKYSGQVVDNGITINISESKYHFASKVFYLKLAGLNETLSIYKMSKNYSDLLGKIQNGDFLTVYFKSHKNNKRLNLDLFQIEKNNTIIWGLKDSTPRYFGLGIFIMIIVSIPMIGFGVLLDKLRRNGSVQLWNRKKKKKLTGHNTVYTP